jgi:ABC-type antimicrobial peptide transport system permease subunit
VGTPAASLAVGTNTDAEVLKPQIRTLAARVFPRAARVDVNTGTDLIERDLGRERLGAWFFSGFGLVTLGLGLGGIFGLVAYVVNLRRREIGIRMALGATRSRVLRSVMAWSLFPAVAGLTAGLAGSLLVGRSVESYVHGISSLDPATYAGTVIVIAVGAASAGLLAAVGIYRLNPVEALRSE